MSLVSVAKISSLMLASVVEQASLSLTWSEIPEDTFSHDEAQLHLLHMYMYRWPRYNSHRKFRIVSPLDSVELSAKIREMSRKNLSVK